MLPRSLSSYLGLGLLLSLSAIYSSSSTAASITFVSGKGVDSGNCASPGMPCRTFQFAHNRTDAGGEIKALDPAAYGLLLITKSIHITGVEGAGIVRDDGGTAIEIEAGRNDSVSVSRLILDGLMVPAGVGIEFRTGASLVISQCTIKNFGGTGILLSPLADARLLVRETIVSGNGIGIFLNVPQQGTFGAALDRVLIFNNATFGLSVGGPASVSATNTIAALNGVGGVGTVAGGKLILDRSAVTGSTTGVVGVNPTFSAGNNLIRGNGIDVQRTLTRIGTR